MPVQMTIGCCGRARHGKDTSAALMRDIFERVSIPCQVIALADPIKDFLTDLVGRPEPFRGNNAERTAPIPELKWSTMAARLSRGALRSWGPRWLRPFVGVVPEFLVRRLTLTHLGVHPTGRQLMQLFGTEVIRQNLAPDTWMRIADNRAKAFPGVTIISDVRFPNEAKSRYIGGIFDHVLKVVRPGIPPINHPSEWSVDLIPESYFLATIQNDGTQDDLAWKLFQIVTTILNSYNIKP